MKKHDEGYVLAYVTVVLLLFCLIATMILTGSMKNLTAQQDTIQRMKDRYAAEGMIQQVISKRSNTDFAEGIDNNPYVAKVQEYAASHGAEVLPICASLECEIAELDSQEEKLMFLQDMGLEESGLDRLVKKGYSLLGLISYLTAGPKEVRAWTIENGTKAPQAAGKIHTDFEKGFIRAEVVAYDDLIASGSYNAAKEKGLVRSEGKEYVFCDGDVVLFRFNV